MLELDIPTIISVLAIDLTMCFIDLETFDVSFRMAVLEFVSLGRRRVPEAPIVDRGHVQILRDPSYPGGNPVDGITRGQGHGDFDHRVMRDGALASRGRRNVALPNSEIVFGHGVG